MSFPSKNSSTIASIFGVEINCNQSQQSTSSVYLFQNRSEYWTFPVEAVALWVNRKPNKEFDLQMTGSQEVLFWYELTIISLQFFINLIRRKYFRIQASMNRGNRSEYWTFPVEAVALWVNRKPNKEFDLQMTGSQEVLFWYELTIISLQFFINLIRRKYFRIQASMNRGNRSEYWTFPVEVVAPWVNRKPNKEFYLQMTGSQEVLFWYELTIISLQFFINLIRRKYFRIQASMNTGADGICSNIFLHGT